MDGRHPALMCDQLYHGTQDGVFQERDATENRYWPELPYYPGIGGQIACSKSIRLLSSLTNDQMCFPSLKMSMQTIHQAHIALLQQNFALTAYNTNGGVPDICLKLGRLPQLKLCGPQNELD
jgi:hypothetical protein